MPERAVTPLPFGRIALTVVIPFSCGYLLSFVCRNMNAVMAPQLIAELGLDASEIGLLTAGYVLAAAAQMVPLALLLDRFGPRRVLIGQLTLTTLACLFTVVADSFLTLTIARMVLGIGVAGCLPTAFKAVTIWFPPERYATGNGLMQFAGGLGAMVATRPLQMVLEVLDWREFFVALAAFTAILCLVVMLVVPSGNVPRGLERRSNLSVYAEILRNPIFWRVVPTASFALACYFAIQGLWANAWMSDVAGLGQTEIGNRLFAMAAAMAAGMVVNGTIGDELARRGFEFSAFMACGLGLVIVAETIITFALAPDAYWPWVMFGFTGITGSLIHPILYRVYPIAYAARAISTIGVISLAMIFAVQSGLGVILDFWEMDASGHYPPEAYRFGFGLLVALQAAGLIWFCDAIPRLRALERARKKS